MPQRLAQHLLSRGLLKAAVLDEALKRMQRLGSSLDTVLLEMGAISEAGMLQAISDVSGVRLVNLADFEPNREAAALVPVKMARQLCVVPLSLDGNELHLASSYPIPRTQLKDVGFLLSRRLELWVALEFRIRDWQAQVYGHELEPRFARLLVQVDPNRRPGATAPKAAEAEPLAPAALEVIAQGVAEEPLLLASPKKKSKAKLEPLEVAVAGGVGLGDEAEDPHTTVMDPTAYSRFASGGDDEKSPSPPPLEEEGDSTRVMDLRGYENFGKEMSRVDRTPTDPEVPAVRAPASFPGVVLPPRRSAPPPPAIRKVIDEPLPMPAAAARLAPDRPKPVARPSAPPRAEAATRPGTKPYGAAASPEKPPKAPAAARLAGSDLEADFSEIGDLVVRPSPTNTEVPPEPAQVVPRASTKTPPPPPSERPLPTGVISATDAVRVDAKAGASTAPRSISGVRPAPPAEELYVPPALAAPSRPDDAPLVEATAVEDTSPPEEASPIDEAPPAQVASPVEAAAPLVEATVAAEPASAVTGPLSVEQVAQAQAAAEPPAPAWMTAPEPGSPALDQRLPSPDAVEARGPAPVETGSMALALEDAGPGPAEAPQSSEAPQPPGWSSVPVEATLAQPSPAWGQTSLVAPESYEVPQPPPGPNDVLLPSPPGLSPSPANEWTLTQARNSLKEVTHDREAMVQVILEYGRRAFEYVAAFAVMRGAAVGWDARGDGDVSAVRSMAVPLDAASVFRTVALTRGSYVGPLPADALTQHYLSLMGRKPRTVFMWPVEVKSRLVAIFYGDCGNRPVSQRRLADFILFCQELPAAFHELILYRKQNPRAAQAFAPDQMMAAGAQPLEPRGNEDEWLRDLITLLTGPDASQRNLAMQELSQMPDIAAAALARAFPGPTGWSRLPVSELPDPDELGPIPGALARLGVSGAVALAPLLDSNDSEARYLALLTAGSLRTPEVVDGVLRALFDYEPDISSAARAAAASLKYLPETQARLPALRQELASQDPLRRSLAARALGVLHDRDAIEGLLNLTGSDDALCAQSAAEALRETTRQNFGTQARAWSAWWAGARERRRLDWLVDALEAPEYEARLAAIEELSRAFGDNAGFFADGDDAERAPAVASWRTFVASRPDLEL